MMLFVGSFHVIQGLVALFNDEYYLVGKSGLAVQVDYTVWGWTHLIAGILVMCTGVGLLAGQRWARVVAVILVLVSMLLNFGFMAAYPFWSAIVIALDVVVILALRFGRGGHFRQLVLGRHATNALRLDADSNDRPNDLRRSSSSEPAVTNTVFRKRATAA
jgi:hypothetical protein